MELSPQATQFLQILIDATAPVLIAAAIGYLVKAVSEAYANWKVANPNPAYVLEEAARLAVNAAEQSGLSKQLLASGKSKKDYALSVAADYLKANGVKVNFELVNAAIEAAVINLFPHDAK